MGWVSYLKGGLQLWLKVYLGQLQAGAPPGGKPRKDPCVRKLHLSSAAT